MDDILRELKAIRDKLEQDEKKEDKQSRIEAIEKDLKDLKHIVKSIPKGDFSIHMNGSKNKKMLISEVLSEIYEDLQLVKGDVKTISEIEIGIDEYLGRPIKKPINEVVKEVYMNAVILKDAKTLHGVMKRYKVYWLIGIGLSLGLGYDLKNLLIKWIFG